MVGQRVESRLLRLLQNAQNLGVCTFGQRLAGARQAKLGRGRSTVARERNRAELFAHAPTLDHAARVRGRDLEVVFGA